MTCTILQRLPGIYEVATTHKFWCGCPACILDELRHTSMRPSELHKTLLETTPRVLDLQLKELMDDGLVMKTIFPELPPRSEYSITDLGRSLLPILDAMIVWGKTHQEVFEKKYSTNC